MRYHAERGNEVRVNEVRENEVRENEVRENEAAIELTNHDAQQVSHL